MRSDLAKVPEIKEVRTDVETQTCLILLMDKNFDIQAKLDELAKTNDHLAGWKFQGS